MGCSSSKRIQASADVYRPAPGSFAVFDINAVQEPWMQQHEKLPSQHVQADSTPEKVLDTLELTSSDAPKPWAEVRKALEDLKPALRHGPVVLALPPNPKPPPAHNSPKIKPPTSLHTLEELRGNLSPSPSESKKNGSVDRAAPAAKRGESSEPGSRRADSVDSEGFRPVRENVFVVRDRLGKKETAGEEKGRWDPLREFPEKCPPGGDDALVVYTTSLRGVRRTYEECERVRAVLELHGAAFDERDVALHAEFRGELRGVLGEEGEDEGRVRVPRVFLKGRYLGGAEEVVGLNESGRLGRLLSWARVERGRPPGACEGCAGKRFVPCWECGGSCKLVVLLEGKHHEKQRCPACNENGLVRCPVCH